MANRRCALMPFELTVNYALFCPRFGKHTFSIGALLQGALHLLGLDLILLTQTQCFGTRRALVVEALRQVSNRSLTGLQTRALLLLDVTSTGIVLVLQPLRLGMCLSRSLQQRVFLL